jgi:hypothetical protein
MAHAAATLLTLLTLLTDIRATRVAEMREEDESSPGLRDGRLTRGCAEFRGGPLPLGTGGMGGSAAGGRREGALPARWAALRAAIGVRLMPEGCEVPRCVAACRASVTVTVPKVCPKDLDTR